MFKKYKPKNVQIGHCQACDTIGSLGTCYFGEKFIHQIMPVPKKCGGSMTHYIYCGWGSDLDGIYIFFKETNPTTAKAFNGLLLCSKCLKKSFAGHKVVVFDYRDQQWKYLTFGKRGGIEYSAYPENLHKRLPQKFFRRNPIYKTGPDDKKFTGLIGG